jgi:leucyl aminopeptidase
MSDRLDVSFQSLSADPEAVTVILAADGMELASKAQDFDTKSAGAVAKAAAAADYKAKLKSTLEIFAPAKIGIDRLIVVGIGKRETLSELQIIELGGIIVSAIQARKVSAASVIVDIEGTDDFKSEHIAALLAHGAQLRHYNFKKYLTKKPSDDSDKDKDGLKKLVVHTAHADKAKAAFSPLKAIANGVNVARDLVNEPANVLGPVELAEKTLALEKLGVEVEILDVKAMEKLKMGSLLCVGQGSERPSRMAVMVWNGAKGKKGQKPVCFVGKGVIFDTGGISIKGAAGMEDMKGDMGGAAAVIGVMHALAERKANVNAVGLIGCVENMPSGNAVRPGDIVSSMSGQTIEVINTDAEGRLVLADVLWYAQETYKPKLIIDLATLTGAIMVALGKEYAGMFVNDDKLCDELTAASKATGEKVWRMPLDKAFDKMMDSKNADMKNTGGRWAGSATAAAFLQRFVKDTPWAHLDVAGTAMDGAKSDINTSWGSGWGVRLLDRFVADFHEKAEK